MKAPQHLKTRRAHRERAEVPLAPRGVRLRRHQPAQHALHQHIFRAKVEHHALPLRVVLPGFITRHLREDVEDELVLGLGRVFESTFEHGLLALLVGYFVGFDLGVEGFDLGFSTGDFGLLGQSIFFDGVELPRLKPGKQLDASQSQNNSEQLLPIHIMFKENDLRRQPLLFHVRGVADRRQLLDPGLVVLALLHDLFSGFGSFRGGRVLARSDMRGFLRRLRGLGHVVHGAHLAALAHHLLEPRLLVTHTHVLLEALGVVDVAPSRISRRTVRLGELVLAPDAA